MIKLQDFSINANNDYQVLQRLFLNIRAKSYFEYLFNETGKAGFLHLFNNLLPYSKADDNYIVDLDKTICRTICGVDGITLVEEDEQNYGEYENCFNDDITIGELLQIARKMIYCDVPQFNDPISPERYEEKKAIGRNIVYAIMVEPFKYIYGIGIETVSCLP